MEIILKQDVENLGYANDIVSVKPGYANNFLIPSGLATAATESARKVLAENLRQRAHKDAKIKADAEAKAKTLQQVKLKFEMKTTDGVKIYGSVTPAMIAEAIVAQGFEVDKKQVSVETIKTVGSFVASIRVHKEVAAEIPVEVVALSAAKEQAPAAEEQAAPAETPAE
ncbi:MAG: 50S ribosomal protein L9 [Rikenellaceae bacterium]|jgi:large subunit ribosomal protein L9|nr:50S ribosomal protein L9 [Rikenellaceae bacterium]